MANRFVEKVSNTNQIKDFPSAAGMGVKDGVLHVHNGTAPIPVMAAVAAGYRIARGVAAITNAASGVATVVTGLATVVAVVATLEDDPTTTCEVVTATKGDQAGTPAAGSIILKGWKTLGGTPAAMTTTTVNANWIAIGT